MKLPKFAKSKGSKPLPLSVYSSMLIFSLVSVPVLAVMDTLPKGNYAFAQTSILRTTEIKLDFNNLVERGSNQNVRVQVKDLGTGDPISSATVRMTIYFPGGAPIRQFTLLTDTNGKASLTLPIADNAALGQYGLDVLVTALGYSDSAIGTVNFSVNSDVKQNVDLDDYKHQRHTLSDHSGKDNDRSHHKHHD